MVKYKRPPIAKQTKRHKKPWVAVRSSYGREDYNNKFGANAVFPLISGENQLIARYIVVTFPYLQIVP
jgi:hypothetical protein